MPSWLNAIVTSDGFELVVGAALATLGGYVAALVQEARQRKAVRRGLASILQGELVTLSPSDDPIYRDPDHARRLSLRSLRGLLAPGILDPSKDTALLMELIFLDKVVEEFNERAALWDQALAAGAPPPKLQTLFNALQSSNWDYRDSHANTIKQLWQLGPPIPLNDEYKEQTLRERFDIWRTRKVREAWVEYEKREKAPFD